MFSMFFGAGNVVFPLAMGQEVCDQNLFAVFGLLITTVGVPFLGLMSMTLFDGDYKKFFGRLGAVPGFVIALLIMLLIGPFGGMPRVIALSYSTSKTLLSGISIYYFSAFSCILIYALTYKRNRVLDILGYILTPLLLISLFALIVFGITGAPGPKPASLSPLSSFFRGLRIGYNTMDLLAAFFFSSVVILCLKKELGSDDGKGFGNLIKMTLKASCIGAFLLGVVYVGTSYLAAYNTEFLSSIADDELLAALSLEVLGPYGGILAVGAVALACLTTAMALSVAFAEFIYEDVVLKKISYQFCLGATLLSTFFMSTLNFSGIMHFLAPILMVCYPALITLSFINLFHQLYGFKPVLLPISAVFVASLIFYFFGA